MPFTADYLAQEPTRAVVDGTPGLTLLEFGAPDCGFCRAIQPALERALADSDAAHLKIEDGSGRPLGRSFGVKLWPTLVAMRDGAEVGRLVRPGREAEIRTLLQTP